MAKIEVSEKSTVLISYGALFVLLGTVIGAAMWAQAIHSTAEANQEDIQSFKGLASGLNDKLGNIDTRLSNIEGYLKGVEINRTDSEGE